MKKQVYIALMGVATFLLLATLLVPHHHHDSALCTAVEHCASDNTDNDRHTGHNDDGTTCVEKGGLYLSAAKGHHHHANYQLLPAFASTFVWLVNAQLYPVKKALPIWEDIALYQSAAFCRINALRAPPVLFL